MIARILSISSVLALALGVTGCGCSETGIGGDTGLEGDAPLGDISWDPPIENLGEPGWRDGTDPLCPPIESHYAYDVWSFAGGVYVVFMDFVASGGDYRNDLYFNDGTGWTSAFTGLSSELRLPSDYCFTNLVGTPSGELFVWNPGCRIIRIVDEGIELEEFAATNIFIVHDSLGYACSEHGLMQYDGDYWTRISTEACQGNAMWASESRVYLAQGSGIVSVYSEGEWVTQDTGTISNLFSIWGLADDDVWVGTEYGKLLRWDGVSWEWVDWPNMGDSLDRWSCTYSEGSIKGMWGIDGILFFHTAYQLVRWDGSEFTVLSYWPGEEPDCLNNISITKIWGNSPEELFIAAWDHDYEFEDCGPEFLLRWDGHEFHWF